VKDPGQYDEVFAIFKTSIMSAILDFRSVLIYDELSRQTIKKLFEVSCL